MNKRCEKGRFSGAKDPLKRVLLRFGELCFIIKKKQGKEETAMKKIYTVVLFITAVFFLFSVPANATVMRHVIYVPGYTSGYDLIGKPDVIYQNNLAFMESRTLEPEKIKLFLRPSRQILSEDEEIIELAKSLTASLKDSYSKAKAIHDWVCTNIYYDATSGNNSVYDDDGVLIDTSVRLRTGQ